MRPGERRLRLVAACAAALAAAAPAASAPPAGAATPETDRRDYDAFRAAHPEWTAVLAEPNYLPFLAHALPGAGGATDLVLCRWDAGQMPLAVAIEAARIPDALQDEFAPRPAADYVAAAERALAAWEGALAGVVRFRRVAAPSAARLRLRLLAERAPAPTPDLVVLGETPLGGACRPRRRAAAPGMRAVRFAAPEVRIFLADRAGLLTPGQVERIALHELGHALGMRGHSPVSDDAMAASFRDASGPGLDAADVNSFRALYRLPPGTLYARVGPAPRGPRPLQGPPAGPPRLAPEQSEPRLGVALRPPVGWIRVETRRGVRWLDGPTWDHDAGLSLERSSATSVEDALARLGSAGEGASTDSVEEREERFAGRSGRRLVHRVGEGAGVELLLAAELGPDRVLIGRGGSPASLWEAWEPWLDAVFSSVRPLDGGALAPGAPQAGPSQAAPGFP